MGAPKPKPVQAPFSQNTTNTFGFQNYDQSNPFVRDYLDYDLNFDPDPGVERRTQLAQQASQNRWNSAFLAGVPDFIRAANQGAEEREIADQGNADRRAANFLAQNQKQMAELARRERLLPIPVQTGGSSSGFNTQVMPGQPGFFSSNFGGIASAGATIGVAL